MTNYMFERQKRIKEKKVKDNTIFGILGGTFIAILTAFRWYRDYNNSFLIVHYAFIILGLLLIIIGAFIPELLDKVYKLFSKIGNRFGELIFGSLLTIVYFIFICPVSLIIRKKKKDYLFVKWDNEYTGEEKIGFRKWKSLSKDHKSSIFGTMIGLFGMLVGNGQYIYIPVIIILVILGIILFFVSSSVMAPFLYTLF